jgi:hypothetical protein
MDAVRATMSSKACFFWVLGAVLAIASVDTIPDPPAVNPHSANIISRLADTAGGACERALKTGWFCFSSHLQATRIAFTSASEPSLPPDRIVLTGQAADSSPPMYLI